MNTTDMEQHLENLDRRLARIEQILPTLATKVDLTPFATKADLAPLVTKAEIATLSGQMGRTLALVESNRDDVRLVAEAVASLTEQLQRKGVI